MFANSSGALVGYIRSLAQDERSSTMADHQLLERFIASGDQQAFTALVQRHASLVGGVSRRVLDHEHDAEDVFQATFLVLAKKASSIWRRHALAGWLFGVANRIARKVKRDAGRRQSRERQAFAMTQQDRDCETTFRELERLVDAEFLLLPEKYRAPFVLCALQGLSMAEAARSECWKVHWIKRWDVKTGLSAGELAEIKQALVHGHPVACGLRWPKKLDGHEILHLPPAQEVEDGHSIAFTGYQDDAKEPGGGVLFSAIASVRNGAITVMA